MLFVSLSMDAIHESDYKDTVKFKVYGIKYNEFCCRLTFFIFLFFYFSIFYATFVPTKNKELWERKKVEND